MVLTHRLYAPLALLLWIQHSYGSPRKATEKRVGEVRRGNPVERRGTTSSHRTSLHAEPGMVSPLNTPLQFENGPPPSAVSSLYSLNGSPQNDNGYLAVRLKLFNTTDLRWALYLSALNFGRDLMLAAAVSGRSFQPFLCQFIEQSYLFKLNAETQALPNETKLAICDFITGHPLFVEAWNSASNERYGDFVDKHELGAHIQLALYEICVQLINDDIYDIEIEMRNATSAYTVGTFQKKIESLVDVKRRMLYNITVLLRYTPHLMNMLRYLIKIERRLQMDGPNFPKDFRVSKYFWALSEHVRKQLMRSFFPDQMDITDAEVNAFDSFVTKTMTIADGVYDGPDEAENAFSYWRSTTQVGVERIANLASKEHEWHLTAALHMIQQRFRRLIEQPQAYHNEHMFKAIAPELIADFHDWPPEEPLKKNTRLAFQIFVGVLAPTRMDIRTPKKAAKTLAQRHKISEGNLMRSLKSLFGEKSSKSREKERERTRSRRTSTRRKRDDPIKYY